MTRTIDTIIVHCSATPPSMDIGAAEIREWQLAEGWRDIRYHFVLRRNGIEDIGRPLELAGAHALGYNETSIGICMVGGADENRRPDCNFTRHQWHALELLVGRLMDKYEAIEKLIGHRDVDPGKECPCFDVKAWWP